MALRLLRGVRHASADRAPELLEAVVKKGHMLGHPHTRANYREELYLPGKVIDRAPYGDWERAGAMDDLFAAHAEVERIVARGNPAPLDDDVSAELDRLLAAEAKRLGLPPLPVV